MKIGKELIKTFVILILILLVIGFFAIPKYNESIYNKGFADGRINIVIQQTQTGSIFIINNDVIEQYPIQQICGEILNGR